MDRPARHTPGRHRRGDAAGSWTPQAPADADAGGKHRRLSADETLEQADAPVPEQSDVPEVETTAEIAGLPIELRRTTVTVLPPEQRPEPQPDAEKAGLLSLYNIGTVPASVTPPASWRKAAWFAMVSSAGVIAALLVASTYLVQHQTTQSTGQKWTGLDGGADTATGHHTAPRHRSTDATPRSTKPQVIDDVVHVRTSTPAAADRPESTANPSAKVTVDAAAAAAPNASAGGKHRARAPRTSVPASRTSAPSTSAPPATKPKHTPAPRKTDRAPLALANPQQMGNRTVAFLEQVTKNPKKALEQTGGTLRLQGAQSLARRYAGIADFRIEKVLIEPSSDTTINTVRTAYTNGRIVHEQRTFRFDLTNHIVQD